MKKIIFILIIFSISLSLIIGKENTSDELDLNKIINLDEKTAVSLAYANNLGLENERLKFKGEKWLMVTAWNTFIPTISMGANLSKSNLSEEDRTTTNGIAYFYNDPAIPNPSISNAYNAAIFESFDTTIPEWSVSANFNLNLTLHANMIFQVQKAVNDWKKGKINLELAKQKIDTDVRKTMYNLILLEENIKISEDSLNTAKSRYDQALINYKNGLKSEYDMLSAQVSYENLKPQLIDMKNKYNLSLLQFKQMLGLKSDVKINITANIITENKKIYNADELINKYLNKSLSIKLANQMIKEQINMRNSAISSLTPSFSIMYTMDPTFQLDAVKQDWFTSKYDGITNEDWMEDYWKQRTGAFTLSVGLPVSTWVPFSKEQVAIVGSQYAVEIAKNSLQNQKELNEINVLSLVESLEKSKKSIESLRLNISLAEKAYNKASIAYKAGSMELLTVKDAEIQLKNAKLNLLKEEFNYTTGLIDLEALLNTKLD